MILLPQTKSILVWTAGLFLLFFSLLSPYSANAALTDGLVGHWTLDGKYVSWATGVVSDSSGQGNSGKVVSMSTTTSPSVGKTGQGLNFDGSDDYVRFTSSPVSGYPVTMAAWVRPNDVIGGKAMFTISDGAVGAYDFMEISMTGHSVHAVISDGVTLDAVTATAVAATSTWVHAVGVWESSTTRRLYINGQLVANGSGSSINFVSPTTNTLLGLRVRNGNNENRHKGTLDDVRIYNRALSAQEVRQLYALGASKIAVSPTQSVAQGLVRYWTLDGKDINWATGTVNDSTGQGHTGKLISMSTTTTPTLGRIGQGLRFDATNDSIITTTNFSLPSAMTVSVWAKTPSPAHTGMLLAQRVAVNNNYNFQFYMAGQKLTGRIAGTATTIYIGRMTGAVIDKNWHLYTMVWDGGTTASSIKLYIDGIQSDTTDDNGGSFITPSVNSFPIEVGTQNVGLNTFDGTLDDARIYNRALSVSEVKQLYSAGAAIVSASPNRAITSGMIGLWTFNGPDISGTTAYDRSGQGNNGTLTNGPTAVLGKIGQALGFDGSDDYVSTNLSMASRSSFTISAWVKRRASGSRVYIASNASVPSPGTMVQIGFYDDGLLYISPNGSLGYLTVSSNTTSWVHAVYVFDGSKGTDALRNRVWLNGVEQFVSGTNSATVTASDSGTLDIGRRLAYSTYTNGSIDEVRVYNRALSAQEIKNLYNAGKATNR